MQDQTQSFVLEIPALRPGTLEFEVAYDAAELNAALSRLDIAELYGTADQRQDADHAYRRAHERVYSRAFLRLRRRLSLRAAPRGHRRPRCGARRPRPHAHRRRGGGRGSGRGGSSDGGGRDLDPPTVAPTSAGEVARG